MKHLQVDLSSPAAHKKLVFFFLPTFVTCTTATKRSSLGKNTCRCSVCLIVVIMCASTLND